MAGGVLEKVGDDLVHLRVIDVYQGKVLAGVELNPAVVEGPADPLDAGGQQLR